MSDINAALSDPEFLANFTFMGGEFMSMICEDINPVKNEVMQIVGEATSF